MVAVVGGAGVWAVLAAQQQAMVRTAARAANLERQRKGSLIGGLSVGTDWWGALQPTVYPRDVNSWKESVLSNGAGEKR
jgi:hypothetical protein